MRVVFHPGARKEYRALPGKIRTRAKKQFGLLLSNLRHPSLHAKKFNERENQWQGQITRDYRFYFTIEDDTYFILAITRHPK